MKEENTNEDNKKELLVLAYNCWWKLRAIRNMTNLKLKAMPAVYFEDKKEGKEFGNVLLSLVNGLEPNLLLDITKNYKKQYLKAGSPPFDIIPVYNGVSLQKDVKETEG
jgi:hypothetical protein